MIKFQESHNNLIVLYEVHRFLIPYNNENEYVIE